jgi:hypothetical protein
MEIQIWEQKWEKAIDASCLKGSAYNAVHEICYSKDYMTSKMEKQNVEWRH